MNFKYKSLLSIIILASITIFNTTCSKLLPKTFLSANKTTSQATKINSHDQHEVNSEIENQLVTSARSIEKSLATLAANQEVNNIPVLNTAPLLTPEGGMGGTADIDWTGPIEPLLKKIAEMTNYNLKIMGAPTPIPIIVSITESKAIIADVLKNAGLQAGKRASIVVFPANKVIELRYKFGSYNSKLPDHEDH